MIGGRCTNQGRRPYIFFLCLGGLHAPNTKSVRRQGKQKHAGTTMWCFLPFFALDSCSLTRKASLFKKPLLHGPQCQQGRAARRMSTRSTSGSIDTSISVVDFVDFWFDSIVGPFDLCNRSMHLLLTSHRVQRRRSQPHRPARAAQRLLAGHRSWTTRIASTTARVRSQLTTSMQSISHHGTSVSLIGRPCCIRPIQPPQHPACMLAWAGAPAAQRHCCLPLPSPPWGDGGVAPCF